VACVSDVVLLSNGLAISEVAEIDSRGEKKEKKKNK